MTSVSWILLASPCPSLLQIGHVPTSRRKMGGFGDRERSGRVLVLHDLCHYGLMAALEHGTVLDDELLRFAQPREVAVDLRHDVTCNHIPAAEGVLGIGPVVHEANDRAEAAADLQDRSNLRDEIVRSANGGGCAIGEGCLLDRFV